MTEQSQHETAFIMGCIDCHHAPERRAGCRRCRGTGHHPIPVLARGIPPLRVTDCLRAEGREVEAALARLAPNEALVVELPEGEPARRDAYRRVGGRAHKLWGAGGYSLAAVPRGVGVTRLAQSSLSAKSSGSGE